MGVEDPLDLPGAYPKREGPTGISLGAIRVGKKGYISEGGGRRDPHSPVTMSQLTHEEWSDCVSYAHKLENYQRDGLVPPG